MVHVLGGERASSVYLQAPVNSCTVYDTPASEYHFQYYYQTNLGYSFPVGIFNFLKTDVNDLVAKLKIRLILD